MKRYRYLILSAVFFFCLTHKGIAQILPSVAAPEAPEPIWIVSDTASIISFKNIIAGQGADQIEWATNSRFENPVIANSPTSINIKIAAGSAVPVWIRSRNHISGQVSVSVITLARIVMTPAATNTGQLDSAKHFLHCGSDLFRRAIYEKDPALFERIIKLDNDIILHSVTGEENRRESSLTTYVIPVVFHIVNQQGGGPGISYAQILSQVNKMNASFAADYAGYNGQANDPSAVNTNIRFCLAQNTYPATIHWTNNAEPGVMRYYTNNVLALNPPANDLTACANLTQLGGYPDTFPPDKYFNIWVVPQISGSTGGSEVLGFATFPSYVGNSSVLDGMVIESKVCGDNSRGDNFNLQSGEDEGKVGVHEGGHYFSAYHVFEPNGAGANNTICVPQSGCAGNGDFCCDTKPCIMEFGPCNSVNSCTGANDYPVANFMNYLDPNCVSAFTADQLNNRFLPALTLPTSNRYNLWQNANLTLTGVSCGPCILSADIHAQFTGICPGAGSPVQFSTPTGNFNCAKSWLWSFPGGAPATSVLANPSVTYNSVGTYTAILTANDSAGNFVTDSITIYVSPANISANITPLTATVCAGSSQVIELNITNGGSLPYHIVLSNGDVIDTLKFGTTTWVLQNLTASQTISIVSINNNACPATYTGQANISVVQCCVQNLVKNGDFSAGNTNFKSELSFDSLNSQQPDNYNIYDISRGTPAWKKRNDIQGLGNSMSIDGNYSPVHPTANPPYSVYWEEDSIPLDSCTDYRFSFDVTDDVCFLPNREDGFLDSILPVILQFDILSSNGTVLYNSGKDTIPQPYDTLPHTFDIRQVDDTSNWHWNQFTFNWNSGNHAGFCHLQIRQIINFNGQGCDYAFDNITFSKVNSGCLGLNGSRQTICIGQCATLGANIPSPSHVTWSPALGLSDTGIVSPQACPFANTIYSGTVVLNSNGLCGTAVVTDTINVDAPLANAGNPYYTVCHLPVQIGDDTIGTGGRHPYVCSWSAPVGGLSHADSSSVLPNALQPGIYTLHITDSLGCTSSAFTNVQLQEMLSITDTNPAPCQNSCAWGVNLIINSAGSYGPYTYNWSNGATVQNLQNICTGTYAVTVHDITGCTMATNTTIADSGGLVDTVISKTICQGEEFMGHSKTSTFYDTVLLQNGCPKVITYNLSVRALPVVTWPVENDTMIYSTSPVHLSGGTPPGGIYSGTSVSNGIFYPDSAAVGSYTITYTYTDSAGCSNSAYRIFVIAGVTDIPLENLIRIYPNPASNIVTVQSDLFTLSNTQILLYDMLGRLISTPSQKHSDNVVFDIAGLSNGVYCFKIVLNGKDASKRFIKTE